MKFNSANISLAISLGALAFSVFTFYWIMIRNPKKFYLLRVDNFLSGISTEFALVNGGNSDVLITRIACCFEDNTGKGHDYPAQSIRVNDDNPNILMSGKSFLYNVNFPERFSPKFLEEGLHCENGEIAISKRIMKVDIEWVNSDGDSHTNLVALSKYGFSKDGAITTHEPIAKKYNLYQ